MDPAAAGFILLRVKSLLGGKGARNLLRQGPAKLTLHRDLINRGPPPYLWLAVRPQLGTREIQLAVGRAFGSQVSSSTSACRGPARVAFFVNFLAVMSVATRALYPS